MDTGISLYKHNYFLGIVATSTRFSISIETSFRFKGRIVSSQLTRKRQVLWAAYDCVIVIIALMSRLVVCFLGYDFTKHKISGCSKYDSPLQFNS